VYGKTWDEAHEKLTRLKADSLNGLPVATSKTAIAEYLTYWLANVAGKKKLARLSRHSRLPRADGHHVPVLRPRSRTACWRAARTALRAQRVQQITDKKDAGASEALCVRPGVRKVRFHDLRHTCASLLHEQGADAHLHLRPARLPALRLRPRRGCTED
jgi:hypothetical protein